MEGYSISQSRLFAILFINPDMRPKLTLVPSDVHPITLCAYTHRRTTESFPCLRKFEFASVPSHFDISNSGNEVNRDSTHLSPN